MKKILTGAVIGFVLGLLAFGLAAYSYAPELMLLEDESKYNFEDTVKQLKKAAKEQNWKIPKIHDLQKSMAKFGKTVGPVKVFELCHPKHAAKILNRGDERIVSSLMPCRVAVYQKPDGKVYISRMNSGLMGGMMGGVVAEVMEEASAENEVMINKVIITR